MKAVAPHDRPREKLARLGAASLGDNELVAIIIGQGQVRASALDLANALLTSIGGIESLGRARHRDLLQLRGIGSARAAQVLAAAELGRRIVTRGGRERVQVTSPRSVAEYLMPQYGNGSV
jgi:DNA repair protein RadC